MNKSFLSLLAFVVLGAIAAAVPLGSRAAAIQDSDYVKIDVPDMAQAVTFFRSVLDCQLLGPELVSAGSSSGKRESTLLSCGTNSIVELSTSPARTVHHQREPVRLVSDNVATAGRWLRHEGVRVIGSPQTLKSGQTALNFVSPWGLRLQLVSWQSNVTTAGP